MFTGTKRNNEAPKPWLSNGAMEQWHYLIVLPVGPKEEAGHVSQSGMPQKKIPSPDTLLSQDIDKDKLQIYPDKNLY